MSERDTIHRLYLGKIIPRERGMHEGTNFAKATERFAENRKWFRKHLTDDGHRRFNQIIYDHNLIARTEAREGFRRGFRLGVMLMIDVFRGKSDVFCDPDE